MKKRSLLFLLLLSACFGQAQSRPDLRGPLRVSANGRYLVQADGAPFVYLGDTAWEVFHRLDRAEADWYLQRRAEQGFTVIQAVALAELDGLNTPNALGDRPLLNNDPTTPNEAYFRHVDYVIDKAAALGLVIGLLPTWGDKLFKASWGAGPEIFTPDNAFTYGRWIGNRYKNRSNLIWILGGDRLPRDGSTDLAVWRAMARGIEAGVGAPDRALISFHPQPLPVDAGGSGKWFQRDAWFDFSMHQTGHCRDTPVYDYIQTSYRNQPTKPTMDAEPIYEDHPVCFNARDLGTSSAYDVRKSAYLALMAGAHGHTYGCHPVWQFAAPGREPVNGPHVGWRDALDLPGANQMQYVRRLLMARPLLDRVPDQSMLLNPHTPPAERVQASRGRDYALIYSAAGKPFTVVLGKLAGKVLTATWFDPRTGRQQAAGQFANRGQQRLVPPSVGYGQDWVLVLDAASRNYPPI
ncbi:glycoside hydrolase family 140 protein [Spirosoma luteolum]